MQLTFRVANKTTAFTARRARPVLGIGMYNAYTPVPPRRPHPPDDCLATLC